MLILQSLTVSSRKSIIKRIVSMDPALYMAIKFPVVLIRMIETIFQAVLQDIADFFVLKSGTADVTSADHICLISSCVQ
jgi:hypothetical protein